MIRNSECSFLIILCLILLVNYVNAVDEDLLDTFKIRLRNGNLPSEGRVEVFYEDEWGTICDDDWNIEAATVVCHMMGYEGASEYVHSGKFGPGEGPIWLDNVHCEGEESSILSCELKEFGDHDCEHHEDAGVKCMARRIPRYLAEAWKHREDGIDLIRLQPPRGQPKHIPQTQGYVEMFQEGKWRKVCHTESWDYAASRVICGQLGFPDSTHVSNMESYLQKSKKKHSYWLTNVKCHGNESVIDDCTYTKTNASLYNNCDTRPVVINCLPGEMYRHTGFKKMKNQLRKKSKQRIVFAPTARLRGGALHGEGRLQVKRSGRWGAVCQHHFDMNAANVACRQLGYGTAKRYYLDSHFGVGHGPIWINNVQCRGIEFRLEDCRYDSIHSEYTGYDEVASEECSHHEEVGIACYTPDIGASGKIRLVGGRNPMEGRIEVKIGRHWGAVCSDGWTAKEAAVVCRQLGHGYALHALKDVWYYPGRNDSKGLTMTNVRCNGDEIALQFCSHDGKHLSQCGDPRNSLSPFAGVICTAAAPDLIVGVYLLQQSIHLDHVDLARLRCAAEEDCLADSARDMDWNAFGFRRLLRFSSQIWNRGRDDFRPLRSPDQWEWHSCHGHYHSMAEFTHYDILNLNNTKVAQGHKASFCLEDSECDPDGSKRYDCDQPGGGTQGIAVGCADTYAYNIDCQWVDVNDLPAGNYVLRITVNPNSLVPESDFTNNEVMCNMQYKLQQVWVWNCHIRDDFDQETLRKFYSPSIYP